MASIMQNVSAALSGKKPTPPRPGTIDTLTARNLEVATRREFIIDQSERARAIHEAAYKRLEAAQDDLRTARSSKASHDEEFASAPIINDLNADGDRVDYETRGGQHSTKSFIRGLDSAIAAAERARALAQTAADDAAAQWSAWSSLAARTKPYLIGYAGIDGHGVIPLNRPAPALQKGEGIAEFIVRKTAEAKAIQGDLDDALGAYPPAEDVKARLARAVGERARHPRAVIPARTSIGRRRQPYPDWPLDHVLGVEPASLSSVPTVDDALGLICWLNHDAIIAELSAAVDRQYADGRLVLSDDEREIRLTQLGADLLKAQHEIAEAIWLTGGPLPANLDVRAVLGINGPEPEKAPW